MKNSTQKSIKRLSLAILITGGIMEKPRARDPLRRRSLTPFAETGLTLLPENKMTPAGAIPAGDFL